jgi:hypothetical protein
MGLGMAKESETKHAGKLAGRGNEGIERLHQNAQPRQRSMVAGIGSRLIHNDKAGIEDARFKFYDIFALSPASGEAEDERDQKQDDGDPEQKAGAFHGGSSDAAEAKHTRDKGDDQKDKRPMQEITEIHSHSSKPGCVVT